VSDRGCTAPDACSLRSASPPCSVPACSPPRPAPRRPRAVLADKACSSKANRAYLRRRGIKAVIPEKTDQAAARKRKGPKGGRPVGHDAELYIERNTVERCFGKLRQWRGIATRADKLSESYEAGLLLAAS
jgi:transposase